MTVTTALYRRYRPDSFADVIGQEHVTEPLMTALRKNRVNHAYLFSGPRGCGKTTSARILARCLNCAEGPTDTPCGKCPSCIELARGGSGSLDVIEIDAASHGGVDDARDLRERATFAPVRDRYKIFIIDEAHMVTSAGFNALLKIVEEPPEHIKFIFATTEPDKVIGTIRSRTHHYPFRLVPPEPLLKYLEQLCAQENVPVAPGVLSLVIRAGGGSVRDSLSVLDQLMAGAGPNGLDYELAVALLGYTHASLLDDVVEAIAAADSASVFRAVDRVIQTGHDPRRFVEDLLERFRDLIIVQAMPDNVQAILRGIPADQITRMRTQANNLGAAELSRAADVTNTALNEMTGATSPRLHLELLCARILLPSSEQTERGIAARIDRVERRLNYASDVGAAIPAGTMAASPSAASTPATTRPAASPAQVPRPAPPAGATPSAAPAASLESARPDAVQPSDSVREAVTAPRATTTDRPVDERRVDERPAASGSQSQQGPPAQPDSPAQQRPNTTAQQRQDSPATSQPPAAPTGGQAPAARPTGGGDVEVLRRAWPDILQTLAKIKRSTWALVEPNAQVAQFDGQFLTLAFTTTGLAGAFGRADHSENLRQAIHRTIGIDCQINAVAGSGPANGNSQASSEPNPKALSSIPASAASVDAEWGLVPASDPDPESTQAAPQTPAPAPAQTPRQVPAESRVQTAPAASPVGTSDLGTSQEAAAIRPSNPTPVNPDASRTSSGAQPSPVPAASSSASDAAGSYGYADDDWGPPLDEDAPPLEEESPADWEPAPRQQARSPEASGTGPAASAPDTSEDPWSRAVEHAPGAWVVGTESNVGRSLTDSNADADSAGNGCGLAAAQRTPEYEPAAAQVPAHAKADPVEAQWDIAEAAVKPAPQVPSSPTQPISIPARAVRATPSGEMRQASGMQASGARSLTAVVDAPRASGPSPATAGQGRQSLYQRLSNSPEAQAGRGFAPARAPQAAATTYVEDVPSADDETIEESGVFGRAAVERILGGKLLEERSLDGTPLR
ncbi:DNA polymerase III subunit gamma and tau [Arthrobacter sp. ISL-30]|uniref:DNA polymerase III subunit gamma and tau n=1 Tax=Arthrobacter sp. ISL-30 TaxID=2819109 RepID=UPI001BE8EDE7|nr:DNA polymerase III subunit gamma and tau [Arthrobacter sp. ISL-30]MBT2514157.1 DNA polymerase III subunit gamma and tau [Arthrobacter sp. ISL-30]